MNLAHETLSEGSQTQRVYSIWVHLHTTNGKNYTVWNQDDGYEGYKEGAGYTSNVLFNHQSFG